MRRIEQVEAGDFVIRRRYGFNGKHALSRHRVAAVGKTRITLDDEHRTQFTIRGKRIGADSWTEDHIEVETPHLLEQLAMQELAERMTNLRKTVALYAARAGEESLLKAIDVLRLDPAYRDPDD
jgi:hypothetical protein